MSIKFESDLEDGPLWITAKAMDTDVDEEIKEITKRWLTNLSCGIDQEDCKLLQKDLYFLINEIINLKEKSSGIYYIKRRDSKQQLALAHEIVLLLIDQKNPDIFEPDIFEEIDLKLRAYLKKYSENR